MEITFPYINAYGSIDSLFEAIRKASVPPKFNQSFLSTMLGLKSSSHRALIPLLKKLDFIDQDNIPTNIYKTYRDNTESKKIMAEAIRKAYNDLFTSDEYAYKLPKDKLREKIKTIAGISGESRTIDSILGTFLELIKLADFEGVITIQEKPQEAEAKPASSPKIINGEGGISEKFGLSYTINLNLPPTTDIEVFNAIFKSLKENLLND